MPAKKHLRWQAMDHAGSPLLASIIGRQSIQTAGPVPEFLAKKQVERVAKTCEWCCESLLQPWEFLKQRELTMVGQFGEHSVTLCRLHLRQRGLSENATANRLRAIRAFAR